MLVHLVFPVEILSQYSREILDRMHSLDEQDKESNFLSIVIYFGSENQGAEICRHIGKPFAFVLTRYLANEDIVARKGYVCKNVLIAVKLTP